MITLTKERALNGIGVTKEVLETKIIQISFIDLRIVINIQILVLPVKDPTLLCMMEMLDNGLYIYRQQTHTFLTEVEHKI